MARFTRMQVLNAILEDGLVPVFYHADAAVAVKVAEACAAGGAQVLEFTNRGDMAPEVFKELSRYLAREHREIILGAVSYTHLRAHETVLDLVCRLLLEKKKKKTTTHTRT